MSEVQFNCIQPPCGPAQGPFVPPTAPSGFNPPASFFTIDPFDPFRHLPAFDSFFPGPLTAADFANDPTLLSLFLGLGPLPAGQTAPTPTDLQAPDEPMTAADQEVFDEAVTEILPPLEQGPGLSVGEAIAMGLPADIIATLRENERLREEARRLQEEGQFGVVPSETPPTPEPTAQPLPEEGSRVSIGPTGIPDFLPGIDPTTGQAEPDLSNPEFEGEPMADLSNILGTLGRAIGGSLDSDPATPGIFGGGLGTSLPDIIGAFAGTVGTPPTPRDTQVAAATGSTPQQVATVRKLCRSRRRRRRMLTKSDIADITTMAAILGKSSEAFKTWLATQRLSR